MNAQSFAVAYGRSQRLAIALLAAAVGAVAGYFVAGASGLTALPENVETLPYPHVVPKRDGQVSLRFAMVHDVLHERFHKHGKAYYADRNRLARLDLDRLPAQRDPPSLAKRFALLDDLAVGLLMTGERDGAIAVMRAKLAEQQSLRVPREELYSTYANLGTFLILGPFQKVRPGNEDDKSTLREGLECIRTAIDINPDSHFGREVWQTAIIEYIVALYDDPTLLLKIDMIGNRLDREIVADAGSPFAENRGAHSSDSQSNRREPIEQLRCAADFLEGRKSWEECKSARNFITSVPTADDWPESSNGAAAARPKFVAPFDEATLGIVGMWRLGGGAHPYFAVALGETMLRVGRQRLAWNAYERAVRLADASWPDLELQRQFVEHCRRRQKFIEKSLPAVEVSELRTNFEAELELGLGFQREYQQYEEKKIAEGVSVYDSHFYDEFFKGRPPIASPTGNADWFRYEPPASTPHSLTSWPVAMALLFAGAFASIACSIAAFGNRAAVTGADSNPIPS